MFVLIVTDTRICFHSFRFSVENAYLDEKADACVALGELSVNIG